MTVVGTYEFNLEDEYEKVVAAIAVAYPWTELLTAMMILALLGALISIVRKRR